MKKTVLGASETKNMGISAVFAWQIHPAATHIIFISTNFTDIISIRIAIGSGIAFFVAQNVDVGIFDKLRKKIWYIAPLISSIFGSIVDRFLFFSISFSATGIPWITLALGDLSVKLFIALSMLIPFRLLLTSIRDFSEVKR